MRLGSCIHLVVKVNSMFNFETTPTFHESLTNVEFLRLGHFSETIRARAMKLGSCIHLEEVRSTLCSILRLDLLFTIH